MVLHARQVTGLDTEIVCSSNGSLLTQNADQVKFGTIVVLKDNEAIAPGYLPFVSGEGRRGLRVTILVKHETASTDWTADIDQSIDNTTWITTNEDINNMPLGSRMLEFTTIAPYWRIVINNTGIHSNFTIKYI